MLVATEAAGEGINLQFCWLMINYDIPWNPVRLEQRMGRIHRYGQEHDCLIFNFVAREHPRRPRARRSSWSGSARSARSWGPTRSSTWSARSSPATCWRSSSATSTPAGPTCPDIRTGSSATSTPTRFREITESTLEGLAKRELNLSAIVGKSVEARERRLVPEVIEDFFVQAAPVAGRSPQGRRQGRPRLPRRQGPAHADPASASGWSPGSGGSAANTPRSSSTRRSSRRTRPSNGSRRGIRSSRSVREDVLDRVADHLRRGAIFFDLQRKEPARLDVFAASIKDGRGDTPPPPAVRRRDRDVRAR